MGNFWISKLWAFWPTEWASDRTRHFRHATLCSVRRALQCSHTERLPIDTPYSGSTETSEKPGSEVVPMCTLAFRPVGCQLTALLSLNYRF